MSKYSGFFAAYNASVKAGNRTSKEDTILSFTDGRTESLKELSDEELARLNKVLNSLNGFVASGVNTDPKADKMRKSIIAIFKKMSLTTTNAIEWAEKQGVKGIKRKFNDYSNNELYVLIRVAEKMLSDSQIAFRKRLTTLM